MADVFKQLRQWWGGSIPDKKKRSLSDTCEELCPGVKARNAGALFLRHDLCAHGLNKGTCGSPMCNPEQPAPQEDTVEPTYPAYGSSDLLAAQTAVAQPEHLCEHEAAGVKPCYTCSPEPAVAQAGEPTELSLIANMLEEMWGLPESAQRVREAEATLRTAREERDTWHKATQLAVAVQQKAEAALDRARKCAEESAKTVLYREEMHDPIKAQIAYDEWQGLLRALGGV